MVLTNLQCWANDWDIQTNVQNSNLDRNVDLFNPRTVQSNISHITSNGYYGFLHINNHENDNEINSNENNKTIKHQINSFESNELVLDTPMMDFFEHQPNGENFMKTANGNFPAIFNENTNKNDCCSISNDAIGGGGFDRKKRFCIDDEELRTERIKYGKRVCPNNTWDFHDLQNESTKPMIVTNNACQQIYSEPMHIEPANKKYENNNLNSDTDFQGIQIDKKLSYCTNQVSVENNIYKSLSTQQDINTPKELIENNIIKAKISKPKNIDIINNNEKLINFQETIFNEFNPCTVLNSINEDILLENLYYQTHGGGEYQIWQNNTEF